MGSPTALNTEYKGLVESISIPAQLHERDGKRFASYGSVVPIHCCSPEEVAGRAPTTHHYCDLFAEELLAPLGELAYVRLDEHTAEKVFINRTKRMLVLSSDGRLAQWRLAPTFESANHLLAGTPLVTKDGALVSLVTARKGSHYAVSTFEGEGGYFETTEAWQVIEDPPPGPVYGTQVFPTRDALREYIAGLPGPGAGLAPGPPQPALLAGASPRLVLVAPDGRQLAHYYLPPAIVTHVEYL